MRVCDSCFEQAHKPNAGGPIPAGGSEKEKETDLPAEYLSSSLAQQNQAPPRKTEEELREEEEFQLALALSQSEAEAKEKEKMRITNAMHGISKCPLGIKINYYNLYFRYTSISGEQHQKP